MPPVVQAPSARYTKDLAHSDTADNFDGCSGFTNAGTSGAAKVRYAANNTEDTIQVNAGDFIMIPIVRVYSTGTAAGVDIHGVF